MLRLTGIVFAFVMIWSTCAVAATDNQLSVEEILAHPDFVADYYSLSSATNSGDPDADLVYRWIGYIPDGDRRIYYTSFGEPLTCVQWEATGEWVPLWVLEALNRLHAKGIIEL